jgi:DNA-binding MarR family transcriptional regulator
MTLTVMVNRGVAASDLIRQLGVSKQAASQLVDTLVMRGYLEREVDPDDRRRMILQVTERGRTAAAAVRAGVVWVDTELAARLSPPELKGLRAGLVALCDIREGLEEG